MDIFSTGFLNRVVENLSRPSSFLLDAFFREEQTEESEEIHFDVDKSRPRLAPFVSPLVSGKARASDGYFSKSFKPAYVKDKTIFRPDGPLKRSIGEKIGGSLSPADRREMALGRELALQLDALTRSEEVMAAEALCTGKVTVSGEDYPTVVVDFQRDPALTVALTGASRWGESGVNMIRDLEDWVDVVKEKSSAVVRTVVMDPKAWRLFSESKEVRDLLDIRRGTDTTLTVDLMVRGTGNENARYVGFIGDLEFYVYNDRYIGADDNLHYVLPPNTVILGSVSSLTGVRCYGVIQDEQANYRATRYFSKSWLEQDPAVRWLLMQSAPLVVPFRPDASMCVTVR